MTTREVDLVIVGASFAGLICARSAALRGLKVVVIESKSDPGARIHTTGILVKEAAEEVDTPAKFSRAIQGVRLYSPSLKSIDLRAPGYFFLTTDTAGLIRWLADEARHAGAEIICHRKIEVALREADRIVLPQFNIKAHYLVGADGARSTVARLFNLGRNEKFLTGLEIEYQDLPKADPELLHCFLDTRLARGYLAWVAPAPGFFQVGLATNSNAKPDLKAFLSHTELHIWIFLRNGQGASQWRYSLRWPSEKIFSTQCLAYWRCGRSCFPSNGRRHQAGISLWPPGRSTHR